MIAGDDPLGKKPDPAGLRWLMAQAHGPALLVGDSPIDWTTAEAAACSFAWARYGFGAARFTSGPPGTPYVLDTPRDLVPAVDRFGAVMSGS